MDIEANLRLIETTLGQRGANPTRLGELPTIRAEYMGLRGPLNCYAHVHRNPDALVFYVTTQHQCPDATRLAVAEFMALANYDLALGSFEIDLEDGEMRFKSGAPLPDGAVTLPLLDALARSAVQAMDMHLPGLLGVAHGACTPQQGMAMLTEGA